MPKKSLPKLSIVLLFIICYFLLTTTTHSQPQSQTGLQTGFMVSASQTVDCGNCNGRKFASQCLMLPGEKILKIVGTPCKDSIKVNMDTIPGYNPDSGNDPPTGLNCQGTKLVVFPAVACPNIDTLIVRGRWRDDVIRVNNPENSSLHIIEYGDAGNDTLKTIGVGDNEFYGGSGVDCANCTSEDACQSIELSNCPEEGDEPAAEEP